ncbi:MAG: Obg family GTPase CgtA [Myxococcota bacterium]
MEFLDEVVVFVSSGHGGAGSVHFRREKFVPRGGPDGGDGGRGGAVIFEATSRRNTLVDYQRKRHHRAADGVPGGGQRMTGARGRDCVCPVPIGTVIYDCEDDRLLADLDEEGMTWRIEGGEGGLGNWHFKSSTNRTPRHAQPGLPGAELRLRLELKLLADVGLVGFPNAGKSTFLSRVSAARARVADYPFTTLVPQLGVVRVDDDRSFVLADIPGLVEGASEGIGLGHQFLRHIERCALHIHLVAYDPFEPESLVERYRALNEELKAYGGEVTARPQLVVLNKTDLMTDEEREACVRQLRDEARVQVFAISGQSGDGVDHLLNAVWAALIQLGRRDVIDKEQS